MHGTDKVKTTKIAHDNRQMVLPFDFPPPNNIDSTEQQAALCRWEDDGGTAGKGSADGE